MKPRGDRGTRLARPPAGRPQLLDERGVILATTVLLLTFVIVAYRNALTLPLVNDDYFFLDKVWFSSFLDLWKPERLIFNWYRPWSRELHYWALLKSAGLNEPAYHAASFALWLGVMVSYFLLARRLAGIVVAAISTAGLASLSMWGAPLLWVAGAQDLWMLLFSMLFLHAVARDWQPAALAALLLALLSKETAAVLPALATAYFWLVDRRTPGQAFRRALGFWTVLVVWMGVHPTLHSRLFGPLQHSLETELRPPAVSTLARTLLAQVNLDDRIAPDSSWLPIVLKAGISAAILGAIVLVALRLPSSRPPAPVHREAEPRVLLFGAIWTVLGWGLLFLPSIGWHAYYGSLGSLGCWLALGTVLKRQRTVALIAILALSALREGRAATPSWDWGTYWYQKRAGSFLTQIRSKLFQLHPTFPPHSRLYFAQVPNNIGFLAGDGPAIRVWYGDFSLQARFYSEYRMRVANDSLGRDYFFRVDSVMVMSEIEAGPESVSLSARRNPTWQHDQQVLATLFMESGNVRAAAHSYAKLWMTFPERPAYALYAATAYEAGDDTIEAQNYYRIAARAFGDSAVHRAAHTLVPYARSRRDSSARADAARGQP